MRTPKLILFWVSFMSLFLTGCKKENEPINIVLWDKPLSVIQDYITGNWKLQYATGGLIYHKYIERHNSYMFLTPNHIILGNDSLGVVVDTTIIWVRAEIANNEFTYLLGYSRLDYPWPEYDIVSQIKNDTLIIRDNLDDGYDNYYTKY